MRERESAREKREAAAEAPRRGLLDEGLAEALPLRLEVHLDGVALGEDVGHDDAQAWRDRLQVVGEARERGRASAYVVQHHEGPQRRGGGGGGRGVRRGARRAPHAPEGARRGKGGGSRGARSGR